MSSVRRLDSLFNPRSVAIIGASPSRTQGVNVVKNLRASGYGGRIFPVHPTAQDFLGLEVFKSIKDTPEVPDCALFALGADKLLPTFEEAARAGVKAAVVYASGFGELDAEGRAREAKLEEIARAHAMVLCGPNCMGLFDLHSRFAGYSAHFDWTGTPGGVAVLSHSGSGCVVISNSARFGIRCVVSSGNSTVTDIPDYLEYFATDEKTRLAVILLETVRDPEAFRQAALRMYEAGKPVVVLKNGRSSAGAAATAAHTGAIAGAYDAFRDFFESCGVIAVEDIDELIETATLLDGLHRLPERQSGAALITISGGETAMACDIAEQFGMTFPDLQPATITHIESLMPKFAFASNPLDSRTLSTNVYEELVVALANDPGVGIVAAAQNSSHTLTDEQAATYRGISTAIANASVRVRKPIVFYNNLSAPVHPIIAEPLIPAGIPILRGARSSLSALNKVLKRPKAVEVDDVSRMLNREKAWETRLSDGHPLTERESKAFLKSCGIRVPRELIATTATEAAMVADEIGYPVAMKIESPDLPHKTEVGGVRLNLMNRQEVSDAFNLILKDVTTKAPSARINGISVQEMVGNGIEVLLGLSRPEPFELALTVGWGGVQVELMRDVQMMLLPSNPSKMLRAVEKTRVNALLEGYRGAPPADKPALLTQMELLAAIAATYGDLIEAVDINPVSVQTHDRGAVALDALVITRAQIQARNNKDTRIAPSVLVPAETSESSL